MNRKNGQWEVMRELKGSVGAKEGDQEELENGDKERIEEERVKKSPRWKMKEVGSEKKGQ
mgnify:CR=1 FL=1